MDMTIGKWVEKIGGRLEGVSPDTLIKRVASLEKAGPQDLSFLSNSRYLSQLAASQAACVIVAPQAAAAALERGGSWIVEDPYACFAKVTQLIRREIGPSFRPGVHTSAVVDENADIHPSASIGPLCVVEAGAVIGADTVLRSRVSIGYGCVVGARCLLHAGVVIGADGFGFAPEKGQWTKIEQLGVVRIGDDVEIGANTCIDRGALEDTVIEDGVKLDNLIQIGHNVHVGAHSAMAGCVGVAGSARIGSHCTVGGGAIVLGHLSLADHVHVSAGTVVTHSLHKPGLYTGMFPVDENGRWEKNAATLKQLHRLRERIKALENRLCTD